MAEKPIHAVIYARISDDTEGRAAGVDRQVADCKALAERLGWQLHADEPILIDNDISASTRSKAKRPAFDNLIEGVQFGKYDGILYYSNSRLTRRPREYETIIELVNDTGVRLSSVVSGMADLTTADGRMIGRMLAAQDAAEAERIGERVQRAFKDRREKEGLPNPANRCFGFKKGGVEVEPQEADALRLAAELVLKGASLGEVIREFELRGVKPLRASKWSRMTLRRALTNPRTAGLVAQGDKIIGEGTFEAILDRDTWVRVKDALQQRQREYQRGVYAGVVHLLAGFIYCGICGKSMKVNALRNPDGSLRPDSYLICSRSQHGCGRLKRNLQQVEEYVVERIRQELLHAPEYDPERDGAVDITEVNALTEKASTLETRIALLQQQFAAGELENEDFVPTLRMLRTNLDNTRAALSEFEVANYPITDADMRAVWEEGGVEERREIMTDLRVSIVLRPVGKVGPVRARQMVPQTVDVSLYG